MTATEPTVVDSYEAKKLAYRKQLKILYPVMDTLMINTIVDYCMENPDHSPDDVIEHCPSDFFPRNTNTEEVETVLEEKEEEEDVHSPAATQSSPVRSTGPDGFSGTPAPERQSECEGVDTVPEESHQSDGEKTGN